jgi:hypothetical protein
VQAVLMDENSRIFAVINIFAIYHDPAIVPVLCITSPAGPSHFALHQGKSVKYVRWRLPLNERSNFSTISRAHGHIFFSYHRDIPGRALKDRPESHGERAYPVSSWRTPWRNERIRVPGAEDCRRFAQDRRNPAIAVRDRERLKLQQESLFCPYSSQLCVCLHLLVRASKSMPAGRRSYACIHVCVVWRVLGTRDRHEQLRNEIGYHKSQL